MNLRLLHLNTVDSTNTYLDRLAKEGYPHGTVVISDTQTAGRGRFGRVWFSPPGKNIYMSILVRPSGLTVTSPLRLDSKSEHGILPMLAGVACARAINKILNQRSEVNCYLRHQRGQKSDISATVRQRDRKTVTPSLNFPLKGGLPIWVTLKWPNDILLKEKKLGGILVEGRIEVGGVSNSCSELAVANAYFIVGIGINVNMTIEEMPEEIKDIATSLYIALGVEFSRDEIIDLILKEFFKLYDEFLNKGKAYIISEWQTMSSTIGRAVKAVLPDGREVYGRAVAVNDDGYLLIDKNLGGESNIGGGGLEVIKAGDIYHVDSH